MRRARRLDGGLLLDELMSKAIQMSVKRYHVLIGERFTENGTTDTSTQDGRGFCISAHERDVSRWAGWMGVMGLLNWDLRFGHTA